ncbi:GNAT family N-acetyltransferase [Acidocella aminolytica]|uniref:N-acetyltransferase GCN5 n=1 Tax=Acidocella aminolytica 101 = DSM 11237 TaxID=1120923 RepID=A0A0D6PD84_9PROT|nr:GNAT family N-acetyltransferase [Acidocella aminolytica]GAN79321.1 N-acetyltransferase GCN5 [Acidocella aminolytica 101 = DSM 11237]GBQ39537.1 histone acetyltransferase HPA2 [Acidocella aminolytica 101 = DSM 11237]SHE38319.1 L-amino acid N-acyltransferase YncA [Acidocella aminolytica 101 = DSM 11237]
MKQALPTPTSITAELVETFADENDVHALAEAATAAVLDGGGFGWIKPPTAAAVEQYYRGVPLVPERELIVGRMDGVIYGAAQLQMPSRNNEAQSFAVQLMHHFVAPYARGHGLARLILRKSEERAKSLGFHVLNLDVRSTQKGAISLYEAEGFVHWGTHPAYARVKGQLISGHFFYKALK